MNDITCNQDLRPTDGPTGTYELQFQAIRQLVCNELQQKGAEYAMSVQKLVRTCLNANLEIANLTERHSNNILARFRCCHAKLVNHTNFNAMYSIDNRMLLVDFDLAHSKYAVLGAKFMTPSVFDSQVSIASELLLLKTLQLLLTEQIDEASIAIPYEQCMTAVANARKQLNEIRELLSETIRSRAFTAFDFSNGLSLYTVNYSDDMSMLFWDRYTIVDQTMKSYYIEQHCIVEHTITGDIEAERFICLHKPSKNSMAQFFADRLVCLTDMVRPTPNVEANEASLQGNAINETNDDEEDDFDFTDEELIDAGMTEDEIIAYRKEHGQLDKNE